MRPCCRSAIYGLIIVMVAASATSVSARASIQDSFERTLQISGPVDLEVLTHSGDIAVRGGPAGTVSIRGKIHVGGTWLTGSRNADVQEIEKNPPIRQNGNSVRVDYVNYHNISIDYEITAPPDSRVRTRTGSGDQVLEGLHGTMDLQSGSGDFRLRGLTGEIQLETGSGSVRAEAVSGPFSARAGSGDIRLEEAGKGAVTVRTGSGNLELRGITGALRAETGSGNERVEGTPTESWAVRTGSGNVDLRVPSNVAFDLDLSTNSGTATVDKPVVTTVQGRIQESRRTISGKVGGGGPLVTVHTGSGDIHIY